MACVHACPERAIRLNPVLGFTEPDPKARYRNENVSLSDLVLSNWRKNTNKEAAKLKTAVY